MKTNNKNTVNLEDLPKSIKEHIDHLEQVRKDFVANVSHELRTPLTVIRGYLETFLEKDLNEIESAKKIFSQMHQHSLRMENIINDLLLLSRLETENQQIDEKHNVAVHEILKTLYTEAKTISGEKQHTIILEADPKLTIYGFEDELKSLFSNIIINAVKYTPAKGHIKIEWHNDPPNAIFRVTDTGIGIAQEHIPRITERFYRADKARSRESGGTGLGLAIAKHVLLRHQGQLHIESKLGQGSTFTCTFPFL